MGQSVREPLFILAAPRSFTSVACAMLGQHPELYGMPELNLFLTDSLEEMCEQLVGLKQIQLHGLLRAVAHLYAGEQTLASTDMARRWILRRLESGTVDVYWNLCERVAPLRIVDKSPAYCSKRSNLDRIGRAFPNALYLHLIRHPRSQGESVLKVAEGAIAVLADSIDYSTEPPTVDPQIAWYRIQKNILGFLERIPEKRQMRLRGEDLLNEPRRRLMEICRWLQISDAEDAVGAMLRPGDSPFACLGPLGAHLGNDINFLRAPALSGGKIEETPLTGALSWRKDGKAFARVVINLARAMGYR
jgi:sulfotransferase family protein